MVDPIGWKATRPISRVAVAVPAAAVRTDTGQAQAVGVSGTAKELAGSAPVDMERVTRIKKAIADGRFPFLPSTIADRLLALKLEWNPNDIARG